MSEATGSLEQRPGVARLNGDEDRENNAGLLEALPDLAVDPSAITRALDTERDTR
jgi:hypothetical protein